MNCKQCGAPVKLVPDRDYFICEYCTSFYIPEQNRDGVRALDEASQVICPVCKTFLVAGSVNGDRILFCKNCKGILVDQCIFLMLVQFMRPEVIGPEVQPQPFNPKELERKLTCPYCGRIMDTHSYCGPGNVVIDICGACGIVWLDYGELYKIINAPGRDRRQWL
jgi:Zn-finger nucleic acid-binding protein